MSLRVGHLRQRLRHQVRTEATTPGAGQTVTYVDQDLIWCDVKADSADEQLVGGGVQALVRYTVVMRWRADMSPRNRLKRESDGLVLEILGSVDPDGQTERLVVTAAKALI